MHAAGVGCTRCRDAHSARRVAEGKAVCTPCHSPAGNPGFPTLRLARHEDPEHHLHATAAPAAACTTCHMTERVHMGDDWRADHAFRVPRPDLSAETGAPDACTTCRTDRTPGWAAAEIAARHPTSRHRAPHFGQVFARAWASPPATRGELETIAEDHAEPGIVRATALWRIEGAGDAATAGRLVPLLRDEDPLVRAPAVAVQRMADPPDRVRRLVGLPDDPVRSVRIAAATALLDAPMARLPVATQAALDGAMAEWRAALASRLDFPETHLQIAGVALTVRSLPQAEAAFRAVVRLDPRRAEARVMLVRIAASLRGSDAAGPVIDDALAILPADPARLQLGRDIGLR